MLRHYFAPNSAGLFCLLLLFVFQWPMQSRFSYFAANGSAATLTHHEKYYGLPPLVVIKTNVRRAYESREVDIEFLNIVLLLVFGYIGAMPLGRLVTGPVFPNEPIAPRRPVRTLLLVLASVAVVAVAATISVSVLFPNVADDADEIAGHPWLVVLIGCFTAGAIPTLLVTLLVMSVRRIREARQVRRAAFSVLPASSTDSPPVA
jgi:hypothetical protein